MHVRLLASLALLTAACSSGSSGPVTTTVTSPEAFTVSYRSRVRLPAANTTLDADAFAKQLATRDPIASLRCAAEDAAPYNDVTAFLGGIPWSHPVDILKDGLFPPLYDGPIPPPRASSDAENGASAGNAAAAPTISRPDLVAVENGIAVFLSSMHGLIAIDARGTPTPSCALKVPGQPKNFLVRGTEVVILSNAISGQGAALLRYSFAGGKLAFVDAVKLENQTILDARLFDSTIVTYTTWSEPPAPTTKTASAGDQAMPVYPGSSAGLGTKLTVVQWDDALAIDWQDSLRNDPVMTDPFAGASIPKDLTRGALVNETKTWSSFVSASDRYLAIPRTVSRTRFDHYETRTYNACTSWNPHDHQEQYCSTSYEQRPNPDYRAPDPATGDYSCNGKALADCIKTAAPVVSKYIYVPTGQTCRTEWVGVCTAYGTFTDTYPVFDYATTTELVIYRFENTGFTKLDSTLAKLAPKTDSLGFTIAPLEVPGTLDSQSQIRFANGLVHVFADSALQTLAVAGNSVSYVSRVDTKADVFSPAVAFGDDRAMVSGRPSGATTDVSEVTMFDLSTPTLPTRKTEFQMPGSSAQLLIAPGGMLGPGTVSFGAGPAWRNLEKVTLFSRDDGHELDNLLLGTEYDAFSSSWFAASDDQRIRLAGDRMFLPYAGRKNADDLAPVDYRLNISSIQNGKLVSERSFDLGDDVIRTAALDDNRSLVFGDSSTYLADRTSGTWSLSTVREIYVPVASYRLDDADLYAVVSTIGSRCRIDTYRGDAVVFGESHLGELDVPCGGNPLGLGASIVFAGTSTGVAIAPDGTLKELARADAAALLARKPEGQCWFDSGKTEGGLVDWLDEIPAKILCRKE